VHNRKAVRQLFAMKARQPVSHMSTSTMIEPLQVKCMQHHLLADQPNIPSGIMQAVLMHALQLRRNCREVFLLCDIQRHSVSEAAVILGISRTAANRRLQLARRRMDQVIERLCGETEQGARLRSSERPRHEL